MHIGLVGLGKMGARMRARLEANGIEVTGYDTNPDVSDVATLDDLAAALPTPRLVWVMVPAGTVTQNVVGDLARILEPGDLVIDGGNSKFTDDFAHAGLLKDKGIDFVDAGVSGGVWGLENGYGLMVGGPAEQVQRAMPVFDALRPEGPREEGFVHVGDSGAGHYAKMVHNGIEYAMMQSFAEGYELLAARTDIIKDVTGTFEAWQRGTVVRSWLLELLVKALKEDPGFEDIEGFVQDSGEGRWTIEEALDNAVPMPAISASIFARFSSRQEDSPAMKAVAALRNQFGGHSVQKKS
ncbi:phosphogluconate dehydrogenase (NAD(+)-dependent, decarboxylating) [Clavibacter phaseoli]|jgi:6-phosphogluconate dehydrogenase|uniref:phosphogluconate dehydrogenase (NAD(+)-dependent, decarboxylating) n=1 Tax=Clavibacter phaseoli TaxID=1734031 RepID=UPI000E671A23|nr:decarboxylating 6-phosphogluconate dehydrogenase [Clavibacter phaseoli]MBM7387049.1 6-phosphogluconate dehydrogenase [Clavibacter michiganensis]RII95256.1 decarboxylating 6-phosphogluconate dehydrogenase [Clavibacter michiganensis]RIJ58291.1 decarboxylating 6-phosphogluconate dehydrogenase [Clavibacter phaseoli]RIJ61025.1 decarboxylating 6-phosphogluconate dehydrogenase [Clavibacter phaseoli]UKF32033.1 decarboxylating 6-phosphogluconate dehydrogenase [Clavibacter phaseoli]